MRSLFAMLKGSSVSATRRPVGNGPEALRRSTLAVNSRIILGVSCVGAPFALAMLSAGALLPFLLIMVGFTTGIMTLALHQRGQYERAAAGQVYGTLLAGLLLTLSDPGVVDFGLAVALLAPVHASLLARTPVKKRAWLILVVVIAFGSVSATGVLPWPEAYRPEFGIFAGLTFAAIAVVVTHSANRLNSIFEVYERAQINAYRHLIEHVQDAVMRFSDDGIVLFTSKSAERLFGCHRYELSGSGLIDRIHVLDRPAYMSAFAQANQDGQARNIEVRMRRDDVSVQVNVPQFFWAEVSLSPVADPDHPGARNEVVALLRDVTSRKDQEIEMREARRLAEEASSAKSRFLATIGHELRTPLNAIVGFSEMMTSGVVGELSPAHQEYATLIHQSGHHLLDVVKMLLDMSRIEAGKFELRTEGFSPDALIAPCLKIVGPMARDKHVTLTTELPRMLPVLVADERACRQILINLLSNAVKFSHDQSIVTLSMKRQGRDLNISVSDRGIGMSADAVGRIGEPFFQAHDGLARRYEGTGLGLSIVKGLVDLHQGSLHAVSTPGEGTTMTVLLPLNGPAIKLEETGSVTTLHRDNGPQHVAQWQDEKRKAL